MKDDFVIRVIECWNAKANAHRIEKETMRKISKIVLGDFCGNTNGKLQKHIAKNHKWLKPLYSRKGYGTYHLAWDILNANGFDFMIPEAGISRLWPRRSL